MNVVCGVLSLVQVDSLVALEPWVFALDNRALEMLSDVQLFSSQSGQVLIVFRWSDTCAFDKQCICVSGTCHMPTYLCMLYLSLVAFSVIYGLTSLLLPNGQKEIYCTASDNLLFVIYSSA